MADGPRAAGASACLADIGVHAHNLALFVTGLDLEAVSADLTTFVPGRRLDDNAHVLLRFSGGARGVLTASQIAVGNLNSLSLKVFGSQAGLEWSGETPELLRFTRHGEATQLLQRGGPANSSEALRGSRMPGGHPEGYIEGFANLYRDAAELIVARRGRPTASRRRDGGDAPGARWRAGRRLCRSRRDVESQWQRMDKSGAGLNRQWTTPERHQCRPQRRWERELCSEDTFRRAYRWRSPCSPVAVPRRLINMWWVSPTR